MLIQKEGRPRVQGGRLSVVSGIGKHLFGRNQKMAETAEPAGFLVVLHHLPDGLNSRIFEGGANFSVGERLRLALARELLRDSDIIIFDESTANLDPMHEQQLLDVIDRHFSAKTILLISHRESSIARFSRRIHLEKLRERP